MKTIIRVAVIESSTVILYGLVQILKELNLSLDVMGKTSNNSVALSDVSKFNPHIIIANPAQITHSKAKQIGDQKEKPEPTKIIALVSTLLDPLLLNDYDETLSIYDSADTIKGKIQKLSESENIQDKKQELSTREKEIVGCIVKGMTNKQIAETLFLSTHTIMTHRRNISNKLQIHSSAGLTIYAIVNKLVDINEVKQTINKE